MTRSDIRLRLKRLATMIFDSLLIGLFPDDYFKDEVLDYIERSENGEEVVLADTPEEIILKVIAPLAIKRNDESYGYIETFELVCAHMQCSWGNLQTRYMNKNNVKEPPSKAAIITSNANVLRKFKKTICVLLEDDEDL